MKPRVLLLTPCPPYPFDGGCKRIHTLCRLLRDRFVFILATFPPRDAGRDARHAAQDLLREHEHLGPVFEKVHWLERPEEPRPRRVDGLDLPEDVARFHDPGTARRIAELARRERADLVHAEFDLMALYARDLRGLPRIWTQHDAGSISFFGSYFREMAGWKKLLQVPEWRRRVRFVRRAAEWFDRIVVMTPTDRARLGRVVPPHKIRVIPTGVETARFAGDGPRADGPPRLVYVGHYPHFPNEDAVLFFSRQIWPRVLRERPEARFFAVGSSPTPAVLRLEREVPGITVTGTVDDVEPYLAGATIFVAPVRLGEGIKGKILEAMAAGVPVVASRRSLRGIDLEAGRDVLAADDPAGFASCVLRLLADPQLRRSLGERGRALARGRYEWSVLAPRLGDLYEEALTDGSGRRDVL